ncbi:MAG: helix-turn-helix domain-containing protein [Anaerolineae bacterium]|jgi:protein-tyrosine-phosphatase/DNA-binding transcriptional ArsR family regulator|nr:helix-turn-helix domain-containing protein [Anaerolineae bacterium]
MPPPPAAPNILVLLAHDLRWGVLHRLAQAGDQRVFELADYLGQPQNIVSYHLKKLRDAGLIHARRSEADSRDQYYRLDMAALRQQYQAAGLTLHPALVGDTVTNTSPRPMRVLFVCTHNAARSQMAEGLTRHLSGGRVKSHSAGSHPLSVHPDALTVMTERGVDLSDHTPNHLSDYAGQHFDAVITVCDRAREVCPTFDGGAQVQHWSLPDPLAIPERAARLDALRAIADELVGRISGFIQHPA